MIFIEQDEHVADVFIDHGLHNVDEILEIVVHDIIRQSISLTLQVLVVNRGQKFTVKETCQGYLVVLRIHLK
jgi:hypothetical protein